MFGMESFKPIGLVAALALPCGSLAAEAQSLQIPVIAGQNGPDYDACGLQGVVRGLDPDGDGFLAVRAGPSSEYAMVDKVHSGAVLNICDRSGKNGNWLGVVYSHEQMDCGVSTHWPGRQAYQGPCRAGWVFRRYIKELAG